VSDITCGISLFGLFVVEKRWMVVQLHVQNLFGVPKIYLIMLLLLELCGRWWWWCRIVSSKRSCWQSKDSKKTFKCVCIYIWFAISSLPPICCPQFQSYVTGVAEEYVTINLDVKNILFSQGSHIEHSWRCSKLGWRIERPQKVKRGKKKHPPSSGFTWTKRWKPIRMSLVSFIFI